MQSNAHLVPPPPQLLLNPVDHSPAFSDMDLDSAAASTSSAHNSSSGHPIGTAVHIDDPHSANLPFSEAQFTCARCDELDEVCVGMFIEACRSLIL